MSAETTRNNSVGSEDALQDGSDEEAQLLQSSEFEFGGSSMIADYYCPGPQRLITRIKHRLLGPHPLRIQIIKPLFPALQAIPIAFLNRRFPKKGEKHGLFLLFLLAWALAFMIPLIISNSPTKDGNGEDVVNLDCVDTLWRWKNECGLDGIDCRPFSNSSLAFRCPAKCPDVQVLNPRAIGPLDVIYRPLVVGSQSYRGDSFICASAIHSGVVNAEGGCGRLTSIGLHTGFQTSEKNGIESIPFDSYFPLTFMISDDAEIQCGPGDIRTILLIISALFTCTLCIFTISPWQFFTIFFAIFAHVSFVSDPPGASYHNSSVLPDHLSQFAAHFLPATFFAVVIYWTSVKRTLENLDAQFEKTFLWLGGFWLGALSNYTFDWIPIQRLTPHDLNQQPGAIVALIVILALLVLIFVQQVYSFWLEGRLLRYLTLYGVFVLGILFCLMIPNVQFRLHHYVLALLLLPGTSLQTRSSLLYQGILLGLFVNGAARWGFASILETEAGLRGDGAFGSPIPSIAEPVVFVGSQSSNITFSWETPAVAWNVEGISILVNDVERYRFFSDGLVPEKNFTWSRPADLGVPEYFRFGFIKDGVALDYSHAGTWFENGTWTM